MAAETAAEFNVEWMELEKLWPLVDYVTVHTPLIPQTKGGRLIPHPACCSRRAALGQEHIAYNSYKESFLQYNVYFE